MHEILEETNSDRELEKMEWGGPEHSDAYAPEKWCSLLRHQIRLADRAACSLATDEKKGREEQSLIIAYRGQLIRIAAVAVAATESLERSVKKRLESLNKKGDPAKRSEKPASRRRNR